MLRCKCGEMAYGNDGSVKVKDKRTGKVIKVICSECAGRNIPKTPQYRRTDKYRAWRDYPSKDTEEE